jgi:hypothetical protein
MAPLIAIILTIGFLIVLGIAAQDWAPTPARPTATITRADADETPTNLTPPSSETTPK